MSLVRSTLSSQAYQALRQAILSGRLAPGSHVSVRPLCEEFGLSATPLKAALTALEREGFLVLRPHRGFFVPEVDRADMQELYELREVLDGIAARRAAASPLPGRDALVVRLTELLDRQTEQVAKHQLTGYGDLDVVFHQEILLAAGNGRLQHVAENMIGQLRLGRATSARVPGRPNAALVEHAEIIAAIAAGQQHQAERLARRHVRKSANALDRHLTREDNRAS
ncbi:GntR family transcriptional regulator [Actinophytocola sp.]|jgi:DNA-binding GntR family transcriptional regulator|uniref:GntR family transcriptional regulator n=1 Tax=Actinophytocola sp. TaxID=1872138 RepID=UPI002ED79736